MYAHKPVAAATGTATLAYTGANTAFMLITARVIIICGFTLIRLSRSRPSEVLTGPVEKSGPAKWWSNRRRF